MSSVRRRSPLLLGCAVVLTVVAPAHAAASAAVAPMVRPAGAIATQRVEAESGDDSGAPTTTVVVDAGGPLPEVGPILVPADGSGVSTRWWLMAFGGVQLVGLFLVTRRARARLSTGDVRS